MATFGERLKRVRREQFVKQKDIADYLNIAVSTLSQYENNKRHPSFDLLAKISIYLNVSTDYLLGVEMPGKATISRNIDTVDQTVDDISYHDLIEKITEHLVLIAHQNDKKSLEILHELYDSIASIRIDKNLTNEHRSIEDILTEHLSHKEVIDQKLNKLFRHHIKSCS